ncbi:MAG: NUDIX domain-containing protein [Anaerolineae bacterium]|nr:NUDIX domain-containing protein [Thermoflexales bacterium]MDW8406232.1 NUDIX domain-containing protein [Anaerolineae bacterium]
MTTARDHSFGVVPVHRAGEQTRYLLVQHRAGHWSFPKGHAEPGETETQAALRELREETGIQQVTLQADLPIIETYSFLRNGQPVQKTVQYFVGLVDHDVVKIQDKELCAYRWATYDEAHTLITFPESRRVLQEAQQIVEAL